MKGARREPAYHWELINPEGIVTVKAMSLNRHPRQLEGKKILLRWNGKHNGDLFLNRIAELMVGHIKGADIVKAWEISPDTAVAISGSQERSTSLARSCASFKPDIVIGAYGD
jgi:hypothetical protein